MKITTKHVSNFPVTFVTHERFAVLFFLPSCCVNSLLFPIRLAFLLSKNQVLKTYARLFEEEWRTCNLRLKRRLQNKSKHYPFELENTVKTAFVSMQSIFERDFLKIYTAFEKPTSGKWKMDLFSNRLRFNFENRLSRVTIPFILKTSGRTCVRKWPGIFVDLSELFGLQVGLLS